MPLGADAAPLTEPERAAEQVGPDLYAVEAPFVEFPPDMDQRGRVRKERQLDRGWAFAVGLAAFGRVHLGGVSPGRECTSGKRRFGQHEAAN